MKCVAKVVKLSKNRWHLFNYYVLCIIYIEIEIKEIYIKKLLIFVVSLLFLSCSFEKTLDKMTNVSVFDHINKTENKFNTFETVGYWIAENIEYEIPKPYTWKSPAQTESSLKGMCNVIKTYNLEKAFDVVYYQYGNRKASNEDIWD